MTNSIPKLKRPVRRRLQKIAQFSREADYQRRAQAILLLHAGYTRTEVSEILCASRTSIRKWVKFFNKFGESGLVPEQKGRQAYTVNKVICSRLLELVQEQPKEFGWFASRWSSELLARQINEELNTAIHSSTIRRLLPKLGVMWNRASPTLCIQDREKDWKMKEINNALASANAENPVFYVDEADVDLNPRIGSCWSIKGKQTRIPTPGKNKKNYLAGALNAKTGQVLWVEWERKNSFLFLRLMAEIRKRYRQAKTIRLIADNYVIHKSGITKTFLEHNKKFELLFQPVYHPWINRIELVWKQLHDTVTRNHRHSTMKKLMEDVKIFMNSVSPFPGSMVQNQKI
jgi:transposase